MHSRLVSIVLATLCGALLGCSPIDATAQVDLFVDPGHLAADDSNSGRDPARPFRTIGRAAQVAVAGDVVNVSSGTYDERIAPANSGRESQPIVFRGIGEERPIVRGWTLEGREFIVVEGFEVTNSEMTGDPRPSFLVTGSRNVRIDNNVIRDTTSFAVRCNPNNEAPKCTRLLVRNNTMTRIGPAWNGTEGGRAPVIELWADDSLIEENDLSRGADFVRVYGSRNVIRNNLFHDSYIAESRGGEDHIDGVQSYCNGTPSMAANFLLVEGNRHFNGPDPHHHFVLINGTESCGGSVGVIARYNLVRNLGSFAYVSDSNRNRSRLHKFYNNTVVNDDPVEDTTRHVSVSMSGVTGGSVLNNVFVNVVSAAPPARLYSLGESRSNTAAFNLGFVADARVSWAQPFSSESNAIRDRDPQFVGPEEFLLRASSPAAGTGGPLTRVAAADSGTGRELIVEDAYFFQDGWAGVEPDTIAIGDDMTIATIDQIDYERNAITIDRELVRNVDDEVFLFERSDGERVVFGEAPDRGAFPFRADE